MGRSTLPEPVDDEDRQEWLFLTIDMRPDRFGDVLGELNRTGWTITGSQELDENRQPAGDGPPLLPEQAWQRIFAKRRVPPGVDGLLG